MKKKAMIFLSILCASLMVGYRVQRLREEGVRHINNIVRIHKEKGAPHEYAIAERTTDFLEEPLFVQNGRALVSADKIHMFSAGQAVKDKNAKITHVAKSIDLDTGMFIVRVSGNITGKVMIMRRHVGFFLPVDAVLPAGARVVAKDAERMVADGLSEGEKVMIK
ncbi:MAG: virulence-associated V antigen [Rickettsiales bacterium]|jgi:hypothetical protein|nr:virulence-associated V antigen [Rickettsiales bacterium]